MMIYNEKDNSNIGKFKESQKAREKTILKIGQEITIPESFDTKTLLGEKSRPVKKGDKAIVKPTGWIEYISGESCGMMQRLADNFEVKGYDIDSIAENILNRLRCNTFVGEYIDDEDDYEELKEELESILYTMFI